MTLADVLWWLLFLWCSGNAMLSSMMRGLILAAQAGNPELLDKAIRETEALTGRPVPSPTQLRFNEMWYFVAAVLLAVIRAGVA